ncbi:unnamed protein product [Laminaria digitata]
MGIAGHQTTAGSERQVEHARSLMVALVAKEKLFGATQQPSLGLVEECMDLFRQAAELYSAAGDPRYEEVLSHMHRFLQRPEVLAVLVESGPSDGSASVGAAGSEGELPRGRGGHSHAKLVFRSVIVAAHRSPLCNLKCNLWDKVKANSICTTGWFKLTAPNLFRAQCPRRF